MIQCEILCQLLSPESLKNMLSKLTWLYKTQGKYLENAR